MKGNRKAARRQVETVRAWSADEAHKALPYITSVMRSLREHWLESVSRANKAKEIDARPGRPKRDEIIEHEEALRESREARGRFEEAEGELNAIDVFCIDPVRGEAIIPFAKGEELAWYVYDLFEPEALHYWRRHEDTLDTRRPLENAKLARA